MIAPSPITTTFAAMGTCVSVLTTEVADAPVVRMVEGLFAAWERTFSRFVHSSELSRLNRSAGRPTPVSPTMLRAVQQALAAARATDGAFDPTLGRQIVAAGYARTFHAESNGVVRLRSPAPGGGWRLVDVDPGRATVTLPVGCALDLSGLVKGMAVDAAVALLDGAGCGPALVNAGGDMRMTNARGGAWPVGLVDLPGEFVTLRAGAIATSSTMRRRWRAAGEDHHHLLDPATGRPSRSGIRSVTVAAPTCAQAEVAAKAALILGATRGAALLERVGLTGVLLPDRGAPRYVGAWPPRREVA